MAAAGFPGLSPSPKSRLIEKAAAGKIARPTSDGRQTVSQHK
jgi:hypothetical protein